jgi:hypothetical protein
VKWLNAVTWSEAPQFVVGSPDDTAMLTKLRTPDEIGPALNGLGPYQGSNALMFDDIQLAAPVTTHPGNDLP